MMRRAAVPAVLSLLSVVPAISSAVVQANLLPQAEFIEEIERFPGVASPPGRLYVAESDSYADTHLEGSHSVTVEAHAANRSAILGSPILTIDGRATHVGPIETGFEGVKATVETNYYFEVRSATGDRTVPIVLPIEWSANLSREAEGSAFVHWEVSVTPQLNLFRGSASTGGTYVVNESFHNTTGGDSGTTQLKLAVYT